MITSQEMTMRVRFMPVLVSVLLGLSLAACDQETEPAQQDSGVPDDGGNVPGLTITVSYQGSDTDVDTSTLTATTSPGGTPAVLLSDVVLAALPGQDLATVNAGFVASDGFDPSTKANCAALLPLPGDMLDEGYFDLETGNLSWPDALQYPGCSYVKGLAKVYLTDAGLKLKVTYQSVEHSVDIATVAVETSGSVLVSNVILKALPSQDLALVNATNFLGADGYDPTTRTNCQAAGVLPVLGTDLDQAYIDPATLNLTWDAALSKPGCLNVDGLGTILLAGI
jgi:hypothetical protein